MTEQEIQALTTQYQQLLKENAELQAAVAERDKLKLCLESYEQQYTQLLYHYKQLQRARYGRRAERFEEFGQLNLFAETKPAATHDTALVDQEEPEDKVVSIAAYQRRKQSNKRFPPDLPRREEIIKCLETHCDCGTEKVLVGYQEKELLLYIPAIAEIILQKREIRTCPHHCQGSMKTAPRPVQALPKTCVTEEFLSHLIVSKCDDRQPHYHLEKQLKQRFGIELARQNLSRWFIQAATQCCQPLWNLLKDEVLGYDIASIDPTGLQVLKEEGRLPTQKSYWYCIRGGPPEKSVILYDYNATAHKQFLSNWFADFSGYLQVDGENIFDVFIDKPAVTLAYCNVHARRKFEPIAKAALQEGLAKQIMRYYQQIYRHERSAKQSLLDADSRRAYRQQHIKPILIKMKQTLEEALSTVLPQSPLGKGVSYVLKRWSGLIQFINDGRLEADTNKTEQQVKPAVMARKMFLFADTPAGANALCVHMSLVRTALAHDLEPYHYYVAILKRIPHCRTVEDFEALLPWNIELKQDEKKHAA